MNPLDPFAKIADAAEAAAAQNDAPVADQLEGPLTFEQWWDKVGSTQVTMNVTHTELKNIALMAYRDGRGNLEEVLVTLSNELDNLDTSPVDSTAKIQVRQMQALVNRELRHILGA